MLGRYYIDIGNKHKKFHIEIEHRINIIKGNSASGKTTLIKFIEQFIRSGKSSGIKCDTNADNLVVLNLGDDYESKINKYKNTNTVLFVDEQVKYIKSTDFIRILDKSGLYIIIISRDTLKCIDYSIKALYSIKTEVRTSYSYSYLCNLYTSSNFSTQPDVMVVEDSNSGFETMSDIMKCDVLAASGKDNVINTLEKIVSKYKVICLFVDGDAFGGNIESVLSWYETNKNTHKLSIFYPDCFEWLLLCVSDAYKKYKEELLQTYDFADTLFFKSWERYYVDLLNQYLKEKRIHIAYDKGTIGEVWRIFESKEDMLKKISAYFTEISGEYKNY